MSQPFETSSSSQDVRSKPIWSYYPENLPEEVPKTLFLIFPESVYYLRGRQIGPAMQPFNKSLINCIPLLGLGLLVGAMPFIYNFYYHRKEQASLYSFTTLIALFIFFLILLNFYTYVKYLILFRNGKLTFGYLENIQGLYSTGKSGGSVFRLDATYVFRTDKEDSQEIYGRVNVKRDDLRGEDLPPVGTPVAVLYTSKTFHRMI